MPEFGIFNDIIGIRDTTPHIKLNQAYMTADSEWVYFYQNAVRRMKGRNKALDETAVPDGNPILKYHFHRTEAGTDYLFAFTADNVYIWDTINDEWDLMHTCASSCTYWSTVSYNGAVIATNFIDKVQIWYDSTPATQFTEMGSASGIDTGGAVYLTRAKFVFVYENYVHFLYTEEGGVTYTARDRWSSRGDETDFDETGAGDAGARDFTNGLWITGVGVYDTGNTSYMVVFTNTSIEIQWLVVDDLVFEWQTHKYRLGCEAPDSIVQDSLGNLYFLGTDKAFHRLFDNNPISDDIDQEVRNLHPTLLTDIRAVYYEDLNRVFWAVPSGGGATGNNKVLSYNLDIKMWDASLDIEVTAFGQYSASTSYTIDTIPFDTIDTIGWDTINSPESVAGSLFNICGDSSGYTYYWFNQAGFDDGDTYVSSIILGTDLSPELSLNYYKRIDEGFWVWFKKQNESSNEANIYIKTDESDSYELICTVDLTVGFGDIVRKFCPADFRGRDFLIKIETEGDFAFYGMIFRYSFDGES